MSDTLADPKVDPASPPGEAQRAGGTPAEPSDPTTSIEERRRSLRRFDLQSQWTMLIASAIVVFLALVLSVPGTAREEQVIVPVIGRALPPLCTSKILFNRECPGCGLTRCFISMAHGDLARAWRFNPAGVYFFAVVVAQLPFRAWQLSRLYRGKDVYRSAWLYVFLYLLMAFMVVQFVVHTFFGR